ncbi:hypothetical protein A2U01_0061551, partial [Trifolium medium]|nr:hypothetical protein [Trifolium medium]
GLSPYRGEFRDEVSFLLGLGGLSFLLRGRGDLDLVMLRLLYGVGDLQGRPLRENLVALDSSTAANR